MPTYYVAPNGNSGNPGTLGSPWTLAHALSSANTTLQPGDTVLWLPGQYDVGNLTSTKNGSATAPILHRPYDPTQRTYMEGNILLNGTHTWFMGLEVCWTGTETRGPVPDETLLTRWSKNLNPNASGIRLIQCQIHDMINGIFAGAGAVDLVVDECIFYNQGVDGNDRGHGHALYLQNDTGTKRIRNCIAWGGYQFGMQYYGSSAASIRNIETTDSAFFDMGISSSYGAGGAAALIAFGGTAPTLGPNLTWQRNSLWRTNTSAGTLARPGIDGFGVGFTIEDNWMRGSVEIAPNLGTAFNRNLVWCEDWNGLISRGIISATVPGGQPDSVYTINNNEYFLRSPLGRAFDITAWRARGYDTAGTLTTGSNPTGLRTRVIPSRYTLGRGHVHVWNFNGASSVNVDLGPILGGLNGFPYAIYHAFDFVTGGSPVTTGTYNGTLVSVPMDTRTPPTPYGAGSAPTDLPNTFGVFVVTQRPGYTVSYSGGL